jgi:putative protein kinase ArgK-like GTPase of G3E family
MFMTLALRGQRLRSSSHTGLASSFFRPCPSTGRTTGVCPGYIKDHIVPLACGGPDSVANLQWQTVAAAKAKDRWETKGCRR